MSTNFKRRVIDKTAAYSVSLLRDQPDTVFTNRGAAGAVTFTLPAPGAQYLGVRYTFRGVADQTITVAGNTAGDIVTLNDTAANSVAMSTAGQKIGGVIEAECIKTGDSTYKWSVQGLTVGVAYTVAS